MRKLILLAILLLVPSHDYAAEQIVEVPLPGLQGWYGIASECVCYGEESFQMDQLPSDIHRVLIRLMGTLAVGEYTCDMGTGPQSYVFRILFWPSIRDTVNDGGWYVTAYSSEESGAFELTMEFNQMANCEPCTWEFLKAGHGTVKLTAMPEGIFPECQVPMWPEVTIDAATLIVHGEFQVATENETWGKIKLLFR